MVKNLPVMQETRLDSCVRKIPWRRRWLPTPVFLPGEFHGLRSLAAAKDLKEFSLLFQSVNNLFIAFSTERKKMSYFLL